MASFNTVNASLTAQNTFSPWKTLRRGGIVTLEGTWAGTVSIQRRGNDGNTVDVTNNAGLAITMTGNGTYSIDPQEFGGDYRFGFKTGNYTSGTLTGMLEGR